MHASEEKIEATRKALQEILEENAFATTAKQVASALGKVLSLEIATGPVVQLQTRAAQFELSDRVEEANGSWTAKLQLSASAKEGLDYLRRNLISWNGQIIPHLANATPLETIFKDSSFFQGRNWYGKAPDCIIAGDASNKASCSYGVKNLPRFYLQKKFSEEEGQLSSGHRELLTVRHALDHKRAEFEALKPEERTILWLTDSANMVAFLTKGSTKPAIQEEILTIFKKMQALSLTVVPIHVSRKDYRIQLADEGTRYFDPDDWSLDSRSFDRLTKDREISLDVFAHTSNRRAEKFFSYGKCPETAGVDAFAQSWTSEQWAWVCPPTNLVREAFKKILKTKMKAILVVPCWQTANFWPYICPDGKHLQEEAVKLVMAQPYIIRGKYCESRLMEGYTSFQFMIIYIMSRGHGFRARSGNISVVRQLDE